MSTRKERQTKAEAIDKIFEEVDPEVILAALLGAVAAHGGITPPLTRILMTFSNGVNIKADLENVAKIASPIAWAAYEVNAPLFGSMFDVIKGKSPKGATKEEQKAAIAPYAIMASGALEAMVVMTLVKNPATIQAIGQAISSTMSSAGGAAKGAGALLGL